MRLLGIKQCQDLLGDVHHGDMTSIQARRRITSLPQVFRGNFNHSGWKSGVPQWSVEVPSRLTLLIITRQLLVAASWGLEPEREFPDEHSLITVRPILEKCQDSVFGPFSSCNRGISGKFSTQLWRKRCDSP